MIQYHYDQLRNNDIETNHEIVDNSILFRIFLIVHSISLMLILVSFIVNLTVFINLCIEVTYNKDTLCTNIFYNKDIRYENYCIDEKCLSIICFIYIDDDTIRIYRNKCLFPVSVNGDVSCYLANFKKYNKYKNITTEQKQYIIKHIEKTNEYTLINCIKHYTNNKLCHGNNNNNKILYNEITNEILIWKYKVDYCSHHISWRLIYIILSFCLVIYLSRNIFINHPDDIRINNLNIKKYLYQTIYLPIISILQLIILSIFPSI